MVIFFLDIQGLLCKAQSVFCCSEAWFILCCCNVLPAHPESWRSGDSSVMSMTAKSRPACMHPCLFLHALSLIKVCHDYVHSSVYLFTSVFSSDDFFLTSAGLVAWLDTEAELGWAACLSLLLLFVGFLMLPFAFIFQWVFAEKMNRLACFSTIRLQLMKYLQ